MGRYHRRTALAAQDKAERAIASGYVHSLGHYEFEAPLNPIELNALWELAEQESDRIRDLFAETSLQHETESRHLRRRLEVAIQAAVGLRDDRRAAIRDVLIARLQDLKADDKYEEPALTWGLPSAKRVPDSPACAEARGCE